MITWIASYPKSGNTWVRSFLTNYFSNEDNFSFEQLRKIDKFPRNELFKQLNINPDNFKNIAANWIAMQDFINLKNDNIYLKTHNAMVTLNNSFKFTNNDNTKGFIYLVRDPRDVIISYSSHLNISLEKTLDVMIGDMSFSGKDVLLGSWSSHYNSWKNSNFKKIIIKYEDLVNNPNQNFYKIINFLNEINNLTINKEKINKSILNTNFTKLKELEDKYGFVEKGKNDFFRKGKVGEWKKILDKKIISKIEGSFSEEMAELKYL